MPNTFDQLRIDDHVAIVTGGSRGLGRAIAKALAEGGAHIVMCSRHGDECRAAAEELASATGRTVVPHQVDVSHRPALEQMVAATLERFGRLDILVNNAGIGHRKTLLELSDDEWQQVIDIDLTAPYRLARAVVPHMLKRRYGRIVNISSTLGQIAFPGRGAYCAAKGGLNMLTKVMAVEWAEEGVTVNAICPGPFATEYNLRLKQDPVAFEHYLSIIPVRRWGELDEIGPLALYLASPASGFVTGAAFTIDGGWAAR